MDEKIEKLLSELLEEAKLLTVQTKAEGLTKFHKEFLTSDLRRQMYEAFDGERSLQQISEQLGCKINTLQIFAQALVEKDLVNVEVRGKTRIIGKAISKIATYYANKTLEGVSNGE